jgi:SAM-dependent methyltransferase
MFKNLIPPYDLNYNYSVEKTKYQESFSSNFQRFFLPQAIHYSNNQDIQSGAKLPKILDLGCGFANMAHALAIAKQACKPLRDEKNITDETTYVGIDIRKDAIDWLKIAYVNLIDFKFHQHEASQKADYVGNFTLDRQSESTTIGHSDGSECIYSLGYDYAADIQWSSSFFTHLTYTASLESLKFASQHLKPNGVAVNT